MKPEAITRYRRRITWAAFAVVVVALGYFFTRYGSWTVIPGMDTMPGECPPGATCIIEKNPGRVRVDSVVLIRLSGGGVLLSRVKSVDGDRIQVRHDNRSSVFLQYESQTYPIRDVIGLVLTTLLPDRGGVPK